jgi:hypothetical protein
MQKVEPAALSRRHLLTLAAAGTFCGRLDAAEFWDKKDPVVWTPEEIDRLTTKSPWARAVTAHDSQPYGQSSNGGGYPGGGGGGGGGPRIGIGGIGMGGGRRGRGGPMGQSTTVTYKGLVRWESAQPIRDAVKKPLPDDFKNHYVISLNDIPWPIERNSDANSQQTQQDRFDDLKQFTMLQPKNRAMAQPGVVQYASGSGMNLLFGFSKETLDLSADDKEIEFVTRLGRVEVKTKFDPKEMKYHKKIAL